MAARCPATVKQTSWSTHTYRSPRVIKKECFMTLAVGGSDLYCGGSVETESFPKAFITEYINRQRQGRLHASY